MKWLVGALLVLNAALFLWATGHDSGQPRPASAYPVVSAETMHLLSEVTASTEARQEGPQCARIGPFASSSVAALAAQKLAAMSLSYTRRTVKSREIRAFRVYLGPYTSQSEIQAQRRVLDENGINDYYVKRDEDGAGGIISLGLFSQHEGAETLARKLGSDDLAVKLRTEDRVLESNFWLEIDDPAVARRVPPELSRASWGEEGARVSRYACP